MSVQSVIAAKTFNGTTAAYRLIGATPSLIGNIGAADESTLSPPYRPSNRIIKFFSGTGASKVLLVAWIHDVIATFDGSSWTTRQTLSPVVANGGADHGGLHVVTISGVPTVVGVYRGIDNQAYGISSTDGIAWSSSFFTGNVPTQSTWEITFNNVVYWHNNSISGHCAWDPATNAFSSSGIGDIPNSSQDACVFNNALYKVAESSSVAGYWLWALSAGSWTKVVQLPTPGNSSVRNQGAAFGASPIIPVLFDGGDGYLYTIYPNATNAGAYGYAAAQISVSGLSGSATDITSVVLPASWAYGNQPGFFFFYSLSETDSTPGAPTATTTVASGSAGQTLPQGTISVASTSGFPTSGAIAVVTTSGVQTVAYTGVTGTTFTGCTGGTGTMTLGNAVQSKAAPFVHLWMCFDLTGNTPWNYYYWNGPTTAIGNGGLPNDSGGDNSMIIPNSKNGGNDRIWVPSDYDVRVVSTAVLGSSMELHFMAGGPTGTEVKSFAHLFSTLLEDPPIYGTLSTPGVFGTTVAAGSNGVDLATVVQPFTLNVASTTDFPSAGTVYVTSTAGVQAVSYTGVTATTFTGCTTSGTGTLATGNTVASGPSPAPTLDSSNRKLNNVTCDMNTATPTIYTVRWEAVSDGIQKNQKVRYGQRVF